MSTISSVSSTTNPYQTANQNGLTQYIQDFNSLGSALQSGDVSAAQSALSAFQQNLPGNSQTQASQPFGRNNQANTDYQNLTTALQSGDLNGAQKAFASLQTDLKATHKGHHHHRASSSTTPATPAATSTTTTTPTTNSATDSDGDNDGGNLNVTA